MPLLTVSQFLKNELQLRRKKNVQYSATAFAKALGISKGHLSAVLAEKKSLSLQMAVEISNKMDWSPEKKRTFMKLISAGQTKDEGAKREILSDITFLKSEDQKLNPISQNIFKVIADWYHYAILELSRLQGFKADSKWISKRLGISTSKAETALSNLKNLGMLRLKEGQWIAKDDAYSTFDIPSEAIRQFHEQILRLGIEKLKAPVSHRDFSSITVATDPNRLAEAKEKIRSFRRDLMVFLEDVPEKTAVFNLSVQLIRLDS